MYTTINIISSYSHFAATGGLHHLITKLASHVSTRHAHVQSFEHAKRAIAFVGSSNLNSKLFWPQLDIAAAIHLVCVDHSYIELPISANPECSHGTGSLNKETMNE